MDFKEDFFKRLRFREKKSFIGLFSWMLTKIAQLAKQCIETTYIATSYHFEFLVNKILYQS